MKTNKKKKNSRTTVFWSPHRSKKGTKSDQKAMCTPKNTNMNYSPSWKKQPLKQLHRQKDFKKKLWVSEYGRHRANFCFIYCFNGFYLTKLTFGLAVTTLFKLMSILQRSKLYKDKTQNDPKNIAHFFPFFFLLSFYFLFLQKSLIH